MRISDWSSDVCSSDLLENDRDAESQDDATLRQCCPRLPARTPMQCIETERIDHRVAEHVDRIRHQGRGTRDDAAANLDPAHREIDEHPDDEPPALPGLATKFRDRVAFS